MTSAIRNSLYVILAALVLFFGASTYIFYQKYVMLKSKPPQTVTAQQADDVAKLVAEVGRLMVLPSGETPTVATVSSPEKLRDQPFFANAKTGDRVLIYQQAKKAILYDPVAHKIVEVSAINPPAAQPSTQPPASVGGNPSVPPTTSSTSAKP